jgi:hypothetical protein
MLPPPCASSIEAWAFHVSILTANIQEAPVIVRGRVVIGIVSMAILLGGFAPSAHALFGKHKPNQARSMRRAKKNTSPYDYLKPQKPQKQKKPNGWYRSTLTGKMVYGKQKK